MIGTLEAISKPNDVYQFLKLLKDNRHLKLVKLLNGNSFKKLTANELNNFSDRELDKFASRLDPKETELILGFINYAKIKLEQISYDYDYEVLEEAFFEYTYHLIAQERKKILEERKRLLEDEKKIDVQSTDKFTRLRLCPRFLKIQFEKLGNTIQTLSEELLINERINDFILLDKFYVCSRVFLSTTSLTNIQEIESSLKNFFKELGFNEFLLYQVKKGSWISRQILDIKKNFSREDVKSAIAQGEHALESALNDTKQAEVANNYAQAASSLIHSLSSVPNANIMLGSLLLVKHTDESGTPLVHVRNLNNRQMIFLNKNPDLFNSPNLIGAIESQ